MIKRINLLLVAICVVLNLQSCKHDDGNSTPIGDYKLIHLEINVLNKAGENLLDPAVRGNILDEKMEVIIDGLSFPVELSATNQTVWPVPEHGFHIYWDGAWIAGIETKYIYIGPFTGYDNYTQELTLNLAGNTYHLAYNNYYRLHGNNEQHRLLCYIDSKETGNFSGNNSWVAKYTVVVNR